MSSKFCWLLTSLVLLLGLSSSAQAQEICGSEWDYCEAGYWEVDYFNLPCDHPDLEASITGRVTGTAPTDFDWFDDSYYAFSDTHSGFNIDEPRDWWPVPDEPACPGTNGRDQYFAAHFHTEFLVMDDTAGEYRFRLGADDDAWLYVNGHLVIDNGGIKPLNSVKSDRIYFGPGVHKMDIYFAERHNVQSGLVFDFYCARDLPEQLCRVDIPCECGDGMCTEGEDCGECPEDCGVCPPECGDNSCDIDESCTSCPADCGACEPMCGDGTCNNNEDCATCAVDCGQCPDTCDPGVCGDGECDGSETCSTCSKDCGECPIIEPPAEEPDAGPGLPDDFDQEELSVSGGRLGGCNASGSTPGALALLLVGGALWLLRRRSLLPLLLVLLLPAAAMADEINVERFEMAMDTHGILNVEWADVDPQHSWGLYTGLGYANDPLVVNRAEGTDRYRVSSIVGNRVGLTVGGYYVVAPRLAIGADVPFVLYQDGSEGIGDLRLRSKLQLLDQEENEVELAVGADWTFPTATADYAGESDMSFAPYLVLSRWVRSWEASINVGYRTRADYSLVDLNVDDEVFARVGLAYGWETSEVGITYSMATPAGAVFDDYNRNYAELALGYTNHFGPGQSGFVAIGTGTHEGYGAPDWRVFAGLRYTFEADHPMPKCGPLGGTNCPPQEPQKVTVEVTEEPVPEPESEPEPVSATTYILQNIIYFRFDESRILPEYHWHLDHLANVAVTYPDQVLMVITVGHTDSKGSEEYNEELGKRRFEAVRDYLVNKGVSPDRISGESAGELLPLRDNSTVEGRAANRRVEVWLLTDGEEIKIQHNHNEPTELTYEK